jgi:hypothetical protein
MRDKFWQKIQEFTEEFQAVECGVQLKDFRENVFFHAINIITLTVPIRMNFSHSLRIRNCVFLTLATERVKETELNLNSGFVQFSMIDMT